jgi:hypothetical protein
VSVRRRHQARTTPPRKEELEGFGTGLAHALELRRRRGAPLPAAERLLLEAERQMARGNLVGAEASYAEVDDLLAASESELELTERPRGLVAYVGRGPQGIEPPREEEAVSNRLTLVHRLFAVRRAAGVAVDDLLPLLEAAEQAYRSGDRRKARELGDRVHAELDRRRPGGEREA